MKTPSNPPIKLEDLVLAHRHLYYSGEAILSDYAYDHLEKAVVILMPHGVIANQVGGECEIGKIKDLANALKRGMYKLESLIYFVQ